MEIVVTILIAFLVAAVAKVLVGLIAPAYADVAAVVAFVLVVLSRLGAF